MADTVFIDAADPASTWRYRCPNGHTTWTPTNGGIWCLACSRVPDVNPHYHEVYDAKTGEPIPWTNVVFDG